MKRTVIIPDLQVPEHDPVAIAAVCEFLADYQPDQIVNVGDDADSSEVSQWSRGYADEYAGHWEANVEATIAVHQQFRDAIGDVPYHLSRSNHLDRINKYLAKHAPALAGSSRFSIPTLYDHKALGITYHEEPFQFSKGWVCAHGDEGSQSQTAGGTALGLAVKWGVSVVCGHTHKAGLIHKHQVLNAQSNARLYGLEVGNLMDMRKALYLRAGSANWQHAFAIIIEDDKGNSHPNLVMFQGRSFCVDGEIYSW